MYVEAKLANNPFYKPACETSWGSCSTVFKSEYAHILSHWGLVPKGHPLDLSLAAAGIIVYSVYLLYPTRLFGVFPKPHMVLLALSIGGRHARCLCAPFEVRGFYVLAGCIFSAYLLYVLKFILHDFCIVCTTFHITNFTMLVVVILEYRCVVLETPPLPFPSYKFPDEDCCLAGTPRSTRCGTNFTPLRWQRRRKVLNTSAAGARRFAIEAQWLRV